MGLRKGQASEAYKQGKLQAKDLRSRTPEDRKRISKMGNEAKREKERKRKAMREQLESLLQMDVAKASDRKMLKEMGLDKNDMSNQTLLLVALLNKGFNGDVQAVKQITEMIDTTSVETQSNKVPIINIYGVNSSNVNNNINLEAQDDWDEEDEWED